MRAINMYIVYTFCTDMNIDTHTHTQSQKMPKKRFSFILFCLFDCGTLCDRDDLWCTYD